MTWQMTVTSTYLGSYLHIICLSIHLLNAHRLKWCMVSNANSHMMWLPLRTLSTWTHKWSTHLYWWVSMLFRKTSNHQNLLTSLLHRITRRNVLLLPWQPQRHSCWIHSLSKTIHVSKMETHLPGPYTVAEMLSKGHIKLRNTKTDKILNNIYYACTTQMTLLWMKLNLTWTSRWQCHKRCCSEGGQQLRLRSQKLQNS